MVRIRTRLPPDLAIPRKIDMAKSLRLQELLHGNQEIIRFSGDVTKSRIIGRYRNPTSRGYYVHTDRLMGGKKIGFPLMNDIDDRIRIKDYLDELAEHNPELIGKGSGMDITVNELVEVHDPPDSEHFDGIEHVCLGQSTRQANKKLNHFNTFTHMKNELKYKNIWNDAFFNSIRGHGTLFTDRIWGTTGGRKEGFEALFPFDLLPEPDGRTLGRVEGESPKFIEGTMEPTDFSTDVGILMKVVNSVGDIESITMYLEKFRKLIELRVQLKDLI